MRCERQWRFLLDQSHALLSITGSIQILLRATQLLRGCNITKKDSLHCSVAQRVICCRFFALTASRYIWRMNIMCSREDNAMLSTFLVMIRDISASNLCLLSRTPASRSRASCSQAFTWSSNVWGCSEDMMYHGVVAPP